MEQQEATLSPTAKVVIAERRVRRWSQIRLAEELATLTGDAGWKRPRVARLESDKLVVDVPVLQALAELFDLDYTTLIDGYARRVGGRVTDGEHVTAADLPVPGMSGALNTPELQAA